MGRYRKKPVEIEAVQWDGQNYVDLREFVGDALDARWSVGGCCFINTLEGRMHCAPGDWIIRGVAGEFYPCKPDIFEATYERVGMSLAARMYQRCRKETVALRRDAG